MTTGTKSLLFGVHQFLWHPFTVLRAWVALYGELPTWRECVCIFIHDWGYFGCPDMDGTEGRQHPYFGAWLALWLFGQAEHDLVLLHSRNLALTLDREPSKLCWADKFSMLYEWRWFYLVRARATGEIREYRQIAARHGFIALWASDQAWHYKLTRHLGAMAEEKAKGFRA